MALVTGPLHSFDARGKCGPLIFFRGRGGNCVRAWYPPVNPNSISQTYWRRNINREIFHLWSNLDKTSRESWYTYSELYFPHRSSLSASRPSAKDCFIGYNTLHFYAFGYYSETPPLNPCPSFFPDIDVIWTGSGASLSWSPALEQHHFIFVRQRRLLTSANFAPCIGPISHLFDYTDLSPQLVSPAAGNGGGPGNLPPFNAHSWIHFFVRVMDNSGRLTVEQFFPIETS